MKKKKLEKEKIRRHIHCIICSSPLDTTDWNPEPIEYVCKRCVECFPYSYILERIECSRKGIYKREFDLLEQRLTLGDNYLDTQNGYITEGQDFNVTNDREWIK